jgi:hypothetical protein
VAATYVDFNRFNGFPRPIQILDLLNPIPQRPTCLLRRRSSSSTTHKLTHNAAAIPISLGLGEKIRKNPFPFTNAEKLDTQNGLMNNRAVCQNSNFTLFLLAAVVLMNKASPIITLNPHEVSHNLGAGSKYRTSTTRYQIK